MKVITSAADCDNVAIAATIGMFDGVHLGHISLINSLKREAAKRGLKTAVVTFRDHPQNVLHGGNVKWICTLNDRIASIAHTGVDYLILMDFNPQLAALDSTAFMVMLKRNFGLKALVVGFNHRFGHNRSETFFDYQANGKKIGVEVVKAEEYNGVYAPVSSSIIRHLIVGGDVEAAMHRLDHPYSISGTVVHGLKNGRKIGFPTANMGEFSDQLILPPNGAYAALARVNDGKLLKAMANIGTRPTILSNAPISVEVNIFDFDSDIYNQQFTVYFAKRLRPETQYASLNALKEQLLKDREATKDYLNTLNINILQS